LTTTGVDLGPGGLDFVSQAHNVGSCLISSEPDGLAEKMVQRRVEGKSWKEIADEFQLGSPSTARSTFKKLTGITDFKAKGKAIDDIWKEVKAGNLQAGEAKYAKNAVKKVDQVPAAPTGSNAPINKADFKAKLEDADNAFAKKIDEINDVYGEPKAEQVYEELQKGTGYQAIQQKTGVSIPEIDQLSWRSELLDAKGDVWKAYKKKPSSHEGFEAVQKMVNDARSKGLSVADVHKATDVPESIVDAIGKGKWKPAGPGQTQPFIPPPPPAPPQVVSMTEPLNISGNFKYRSQADYDKWDLDLGPVDLKQGEVQAVRSYCGSGYYEINSALRQAGATPHRYTPFLDRAMRPIPFDTKVTRQCGTRAFRDMGVIDPKDLLSKVGEVYEDRGFLSTTRVENGIWSGNIKLQISVPKGTMCRWVRPISSHKSEQELLLGRNTKMVITEVAFDGRGGAVVQAVVMP
jgi:hypothetical protein